MKISIEYLICDICGCRREYYVHEEGSSLSFDVGAHRTDINSIHSYDICDNCVTKLFKVIKKTITELKDPNEKVNLNNSALAELIK